MDYSRILNKPFFVKNIAWDSTQAVNTVLSTLNFPLDFLTNPLVQVPFNASVYYRAKSSVLLQVSGTPMHAGTLLASALPVGAGTNCTSAATRINTLMTSPHVFLHANESTPALLEIPFYVNTKLASISLDNNTPSYASFTGNYANVVLQVLNQLSVPTSGSTSLTVSVHVIFKELEFYVPHVNPTYVAPTAFSAFEAEFDLVQTTRGFVTNIFDATATGIKAGSNALLDTLKPRINDAIDMGRGKLRAMTGLHNPADTTIFQKVAVQSRQYNNIVDAPIQLEKLDPYSQFSHYTKDYTFDTARDEMDVLSIATKPQYLGTFNVASSDAAGKLLFSRPITPFQDTLRTVNTKVDSDQTRTVAVQTSTSLLQTLFFMSRYWRGTLKVHVQAVMSNFQYCKLTLARNYSCDVRAITQVPSFDSIPNLMMESVEFSAGGQVQTFELPFCSPLEQLPNCIDYVANALSHGMYYIYLHQPLVNNGSTTYNARFNVYLSAGDDFQIFGYSSRPMNMIYAGFNQDIGRTPENPNLDRTVELGVNSGAGVPFGFAAEEETDFKSESADVDASQEDILFKVKKTDDVPETDLRPIVSIRDIIRRFNRVWYERFVPIDLAARRNIAVFDVASLLGVRGPVTTSVPGVNNAVRIPASPLQILSGMYMGYSGGARFKVNLIGTTAAEVWYVPPGFTTQGWSTTDPANNKNWRGTVPFPFSSSDPFTSANQQATNTFYQFAERDAPSPNILVRMLTPTVGQERANLYNSSSNIDVSFDTGDGTNRMPMAGCSFEFEVPHMTPYRFIGDAAKQKVPLVNTFPNMGAETNMGHLVIKFGSPIVYYPATVPIPMDVAVEIFAAVDDVGRFGYHTMSPQISFPVGSVATPNVGVYDPVWLTSEYTPLHTSTVSFDPYPRARVLSNATPPVYDYTAMYYST
jgi:hypothetical protein